MQTWEKLMDEARATRDALAAEGKLTTAIQRIVAYNSQVGFLSNLALMVALDETR